MLAVVRIYLKHAAILLAAGLFFHLAAPRSGEQDTPKRPRITDIDHVRLYVTDLDKSRGFYMALVGFRLGSDACRGIFRPCFTVGWQRHQAIELEQAPSPAPKNWLAHISSRTENVHQRRRYLVADCARPRKISRDGS